MVDTNGILVAKYNYDPFGNLLGMSGPLAESNSYRFSCKEWHANSGLYYYGYRYYEPNFQRWVNRDPIQEWGGINLYGFVKNLPTIFGDRDGLDAVILVGRNKADPTYLSNKAADFAAAYERYNLLSGKKAKVCEVRSVEDVNNALQNATNIDTLVYYGHASADALYLSDNELKTSDVPSLDFSNIQPGADIRLMGCSTAGNTNSIANAFADNIGEPVVGYASGLSFGIPIRLGTAEHNIYLGTVLRAMPRGQKVIVRPRPK